MSDGETGFYVDPFVSRYGLFWVGLGFSLPPRQDLINDWTALTGGKTAAAVLVSHSHYDHVMDAPFFCPRSPCPLFLVRKAHPLGRPGRRVCPNIRSMLSGTGKKFPLENLPPRYPGTTARPCSANSLASDIHQPVVPPAPASVYREGGSFAILVESIPGAAFSTTAVRASLPAFLQTSPRM
ncbi:MAG: MBL fold metallo-hydrolase [Desulfobacterales bacterium]